MLNLKSLTRRIIIWGLILFSITSTSMVFFYGSIRKNNSIWTNELILWNKSMKANKKELAIKHLKNMNCILNNKTTKIQTFVEKFLMTSHYNTMVYRRKSLLLILEYKMLKTYHTKEQMISFIEKIDNFLKGYNSQSEVFKNFNICAELLIKILMDEGHNIEGFNIKELIQKYNITRIQNLNIYTHYLANPNDRHAYLSLLINASIPELEDALFETLLA